MVLLLGAGRSLSYHHYGVSFNSRRATCELTLHVNDDEGRPLSIDGNALIRLITEGDDPGRVPATAI